MPRRLRDAMSKRHTFSASDDPKGNPTTDWAAARSARKLVVNCMIREAVEKDVTRGMSAAKSRKVRLFYSISRIYKWVHEMKLEHELIPNFNYRELHSSVRTTVYRPSQKAFDRS
jgi:hypothetical protein